MDEEKQIELKSIIRGILLSLGHQATEGEFRRQYEEQEEESFNEVLQKYKKSFFSFMSSLSDVCRLKKGLDGRIEISRITNKDTTHMDKLTIRKGKRSAFCTTILKP